MKKHLLLLGFVFTIICYSCSSSLRELAKEGKYEKLKERLENGAYVNTKDNRGYTPLIEAASAGHTEIVKLLLKHGAKVNQKTESYEYTALHFASKYGYVEIVEALLESGAEIDYSSEEFILVGGAYNKYNDGTYGHRRFAINEGPNALAFAVENGHTKIVKLLLNKGCDPSKSYIWPGVGPDMLISNSQLFLMSLVQEIKINVPPTNERYAIPIYRAKFLGFDGIVDLLEDFNDIDREQSNKKSRLSFNGIYTNGNDNFFTYLKFLDNSTLTYGQGTKTTETNKENEIDKYKLTSIATGTYEYQDNNILIFIKSEERDLSFCGNIDNLTLRMDWIDKTKSDQGWSEYKLNLNTIQDNVDINNTENRLRFDGIYRSAQQSEETWDYLRFYPEYIVIKNSSASQPNDLKNWFNKYHPWSRVSVFTIEGNNISFSTNFGNVVIDYSGEIVGNEILFDIYYHKDQSRGSERFEFLKW